jgi:hypothetical protein
MRTTRPWPTGRALAVIVFAGIGPGLAPGGPARGVGALCNGQPASSPALDASGEPGPAILQGTHGADVIIGSAGGHDVINGNGGNDVVCGGPGGHGSINVGPGNAVVLGSGGYDRITGTGPGHFTFLGGPLGHNVLMNRGGTANLYGGPGGGNVLIHAGPSDNNFDKMDGAGPATCASSMAVTRSPGATTALPPRNLRPTGRLPPLRRRQAPGQPQRRQFAGNRSSTVRVIGCSKLTARSTGSATPSPWATPPLAPVSSRST